MLEQFKFSEKVKEEIIRLVFYQRHCAKVVAQKYGLPNVHIIAKWIRVYKSKLEKGAITLPPMQKPKRKDTKALQKRIKQLEKSLEKANVLIYGLNAMIDYAEKELKIPIRKKPGTKQCYSLKKSILQGWGAAHFVSCLVKPDRHFIVKNGCFLNNNTN